MADSAVKGGNAGFPSKTCNRDCRMWFRLKLVDSLSKKLAKCTRLIEDTDDRVSESMGFALIWRESMILLVVFSCSNIVYESPLNIIICGGQLLLLCCYCC